LACHPTPAVSLCCYYCLHSLRAWPLAPPPFSRVGSTFHPNLAESVRLKFLIFAFQIYSRLWGGCSQSPHRLLWIMFPGHSVGRSHVMLVAHLLVLQFMQAALRSAGGGKCMPLFLW
jgi:hypothetical protein